MSASECPLLPKADVAAGPSCRLNGRYLVGVAIGHLPGCLHRGGRARVVAVTSAEVGPSAPFMMAVRRQR